MLGHRWFACAARTATATLLAFSATACAVPPPPAALTTSYDPAARVPASRYRPVTAGTRDFLPVEPLPWGETNRNLAPQLLNREQGQ